MKTFFSLLQFSYIDNLILHENYILKSISYKWSRFGTPPISTSNFGMSDISFSSFENIPSYRWKQDGGTTHTIP